MPRSDETKPSEAPDWVPCRVYARDSIPGCRRIQLEPVRDQAEYCSFAGVVRFVYGGETWELSIHGPYGLVVVPTPRGAK